MLNQIKKNSKRIDKFLKKYFNNQQYSNLITPMKYGILFGGKKVRSTIILNAGKILNVKSKNLINICAAVECIHSYSLIHDDLPCMDDDKLRRGKPSTHVKFGESTAILAGNSLLTLAFEIIVNKNYNIEPSKKVELIKKLSECSGHTGIAGGQFLDLSYEKRKIGSSNIINMQKKKTGELFGFCCESVGIIKGLNSAKRKKLKEIGIDIGLLFQTVDDLIDYKGSSTIVGKPTRKDKKKGKATLVSLLGHEETINFAKNLKKKIDKKIKKYGTKADDLLNSVEFILERKF